MRSTHQAGDRLIHLVFDGDSVEVSGEDARSETVTGEQPLPFDILKSLTEGDMPPIGAIQVGVQRIEYCRWAGGPGPVQDALTRIEGLLAVK